MTEREQQFWEAVKKNGKLVVARNIWNALLAFPPDSLNVVILSKVEISVSDHLEPGTCATFPDLKDFQLGMTQEMKNEVFRF